MESEQNIRDRTRIALETGQCYWCLWEIAHVCPLLLIIMVDEVFKHKERMGKG